MSFAVKTWNVGDVLSAADMNQYVRDAMSWLGGSDGRSATLPTTGLVEGMVYDYVADATNGIIWRVKYNTAEATNKWEFVGGSSLFAETQSNLTFEARLNTSYGDLATVGPAIAVPRAGDFDVIVGCVMGQDGGSSDARMSYAIGGSGATDNDCLYMQDGPNAAGAYIAGSRKRRKALTAVTVTAKYRSGGAGQAEFTNRWMEILPVRII